MVGHYDHRTRVERARGRGKEIGADRRQFGVGDLTYIHVPCLSSLLPIIHIVLVDPVPEAPVTAARPPPGLLSDIIANAQSPLSTVRKGVRLRSHMSACSLDAIGLKASWSAVSFLLPHTTYYSCWTRSYQCCQTHGLVTSND